MKLIFYAIACFARACLVAVGGPAVAPLAFSLATVAGGLFTAAVIPLGRNPRSIFETRRAGLA